MSIKAQHVQPILDECLQNFPEVFVVSLSVSASDVRPKVTVTADGENGISIDQCAALSRCMGRRIDEQYPEASYVLEVTSPGADQPLILPRQYPRHIGRTLKVSLKDGSEKTGKLEAVTETGIELTEEIKEKGKKATFVPAQIAFEDISKTNIVLSFK